MSVISLSITESVEQVVSGIPRSVVIVANIPSIIFYTLDGSTPTTFSTQYTGPIILPTSSLNLILKIFATNGLDSSPVITETYFTNIINNARLPRSATTAPAQENISNSYPFGNAPIQPNANFLNPAEAGITVDNPALPSAPTGFDGAGNPTAFTNQPYNLQNYSVKYPTNDFQNAPNINVGVFPENSKIEQEPPVQNQSYINTNMFDPRAFVIFQDSTLENPNDPPTINRMNFSLEDPNKSRDGNNYYNCGLDAPPTNGTFVRSHYNPRTGMITYYYFDSWANKWIISTTPYNSNGPWDGNMSAMAVAGGGAGGKYVYEWIPFAKRTLF